MQLLVRCTFHSFSYKKWPSAIVRTYGHDTPTTTSPSRCTRFDVWNLGKLTSIKSFLLCDALAQSGVAPYVSLSRQVHGSQHYVELLPVHVRCRNRERSILHSILECLYERMRTRNDTFFGRSTEVWNGFQAPYYRNDLTTGDAHTFWDLDVMFWCWCKLTLV